MTMTKMILSLVLCLLTAGYAAASRWEPYGTTREGGKCYYKPAGMVREKDTLRVWEKTAGTKSDLEQGIGEARRLTELDCAGQRFKTLISVTYPADGSGELVVSREESPWQPITPDSLSGSLARKLCTASPQGAQEAGQK